MHFSIQSFKQGVVDCTGQKEVTILIEDLSILMVQAVPCLAII